MDIPRLDAKGVLVEFVNDSIKLVFLVRGYTAATSDQDKAIREFLQGRDVFVSQPTGEGKSLCFAALPGVFDFLKQHLTVSTAKPFGRTNEHMRRCEPTDFAYEGPGGQV